MTLLDIVGRDPVPQPWAEGDNIPWHEPAFSARMLAEHLSQAHDAASRRAEIIDRQVAWIHEAVLDGRPSKVLDLGCGPGLYTSRLARLGHTCFGIDYSPAAIAYARGQASAESLACDYAETDLRQADLGRADLGHSFDLVMMLYGEFNVLRPECARDLLLRVRATVGDGGQVLLEPHTAAAVAGIGHDPPEWYAADRGLFSERPHLVLTDHGWHEPTRTATTRYYVIDASDGTVTRLAHTFQAYTEQEYAALLTGCGFRDVRLWPSLVGVRDPSQADLLAIAARAAA